MNIDSVPIPNSWRGITQERLHDLMINTHDPKELTYNEMIWYTRYLDIPKQKKGRSL